MAVYLDRRFRIRVWLIVMVLASLAVAGCASPGRWDYTPRKSHVVRSGETLFVIANRYNKNAAALARWNSLGDGSLIYPGQVIRLTAPEGGVSSGSRASARRSPAPRRRVPPPPADPSPGWEWPAAGRIASEFNRSSNSATGLIINGRSGQPVRAAAAGKVVYSGGGLIGYGQLIILKHNNTYLSAYGYNASLLVKEGDAIKKGQAIATMGDGPGDRAQLHFEIRKNGEPVNPRQYLPKK